MLDWDRIWSAATRMKKFVEVARPHVCKAGGDAVISEINGQGAYIRATIIRFR